MSDAAPESTADAPAGDPRRLLMMGLAAAAVVVLFVTTVSIILIFALRTDVINLEEQARRNAKATKAMQEELVELKENLKAVNKKPVVVSSAAPRAGNIDAADPVRDCVIRPGDKSGVANCLEVGPKESH